MSDIFLDKETKISVDDSGPSNSHAYMNEEDLSASLSYDKMCADMTELNLSGGTNKHQSENQHQKSEILQQQQQQQQQQLQLQQQQQQQQQLRLHQYPQQDGSDSGVDFATSTNATLQRALSNNSGGYASSGGGGIDETTHGVNTMSCGSSMLSCASDLFELKTCAGIVGNGCSGAPASQASNTYECCSDNGSESSSVAGQKPRTCCRTGSLKKKVATPAKASPCGTPCMRASTKGKDAGSCGAVNVSAADAAQIAMASRTRLVALKRTASLSRPNALPTTSVAGAGRQRQTERNFVHNTPSRMLTNSSALMARCTQSRAGKPQKPDSLPSTLSRTQSLSRARTPVTPTDDGRWPGVVHTRSTAGSAVFAIRRGQSVTPDLPHGRTRSTIFTSTDVVPRNSNANLYGTLPRRRKQKSVEDLTVRQSRSNSISRDTRMTSSVVMGSRRNLVNSYGGAATPVKMQPQASASASGSSSRIASIRKAQSTKTRIYHETCVQTALTGDDLERAFVSGLATTIRPIEAVEQCDRETQSDCNDRELERLRDEICQLTQREQEMTAKLQSERAEKVAMQREQNANAERVMAMLEMTRSRLNGSGTSTAGGDGSRGVTPTSDDSGGHDSLLMLESQIQLSGNELTETKQEIAELRTLCRSLQMEVERSLITQECLMEEKSVMEHESNELQEFLQNEKAAMFDALKDLESEFILSKRAKDNVEEEARVLRDECRRLVCLNEQRRQENRMMQTKCCTLEARSKDLTIQHNFAVSSASAALNSLHVRLDDLVGDLIASYNISETELENGTLLNCEQPNEGASTSSGLTLPEQMLHLNDNRSLQQKSNDGSLSPQRNQSFIAAVINSIRNATSSSAKRSSLMRQARHISHNRLHSSNNNSSNNNNNYSHQQQQQLQQQQEHNRLNYQNERMNDETNTCDSDSTEMLDSETEPCLMMDNVLEDVTMPDSHSHNMVSSGMISQIDVPSELANNTPAGEDSQQALETRQPLEQIHNQPRLPALQINHNDHSLSEGMSVHDSSVAEIPSLGDYCSAHSLVDQVIELDALVTKLLRVLGRLQMDNDTCIHHLVIDKNKLQQSQGDIIDKLKDLEDANVKLQSALVDATEQLEQKDLELASSKTDVQRQRSEIDRLAEDICSLSTLCSNYRKLSPTTELPPMPQQLRLNGALAAYEGSVDGGNDVASILNLLRMWHADGQLKDARVHSFLCDLLQPASTTMEHGARLRIYANQLENVLRVLGSCADLDHSYPALQALRRDIEIVKLNANWTQLDDVDVAAGAPAATANKDDAIRDCGDDAASGMLSKDINANAAGVLHTANTPMFSL